MADPWEEAAKQFKQPASAQGGTKPLLANEDWKLWTPQANTPAPRVGGQKVLDYANDTLSNVPSSAAKLAKGIGTAVAHPLDTIGNLGKVVAGTAQNMTPGYVTPDRPGYSKEADASWGAIKDRYGSPHAIAESIRTDPVGVASDISALAGGVSGLARGGAAVADAANFGKTASAASKLADVASTVSDATNPVSLVTKPVGAALKATGKGLVRSALPGLGGKTERYGATPATAVLEETSGLTPSAIKQSAISRIADLKAQLDAVTARAKAAGSTMDLSAARQVILDEMTEVAKNNGLTDELAPMYKQLTSPRPGFGGAVNATSGEIEAMQDPVVGLGMKRQFGNDYTKFDAAVPMKNDARKLGNRAYHELSTEFNRAVPEAEPINRQLQSVGPIPAAAQRADELAGPVQNLAHRATAPTGALAATLAHGPMALAAQTALATPAVKMGAARTAYGAGKAMKSPITSRAVNAAGVAGEASDTIAKQLSDAILGGNQ